VNTLYLILLILAAVCFLLAVREWFPRGDRRPAVSFLALGLFFWVLVPLIQTAQAL
jgi:hypothetical protein